MDSFGGGGLRGVEMLFTVAFTFSEGGGVLLSGCSAEGARPPVAGELLEVRSPDGERAQACARRVQRGPFSLASPAFARPIDRAVLFVPGALPMRSWLHSEVWAVGEAPDAAPGTSPADGGG